MFWQKCSQHFSRKIYFSKTYPFVVKLSFSGHSYHLFNLQAELCCFLHCSHYFGNEKVKGQGSAGAGAGSKKSGSGSNTLLKNYFTQ